MKGRHSFNDRDRQVTRDCISGTSATSGLAGDSAIACRPPCSPAAPGQRLDPTLRGRCIRCLPTCTGSTVPHRAATVRDHRRNIVMIDDGYQVQDVFTLSLNF